ncbi:MAG: alpha-amylase [Sphingomonadales bacterium]|nr:alpha-amylase [Sphingomonadales bacterium]
MQAPEWMRDAVLYQLNTRQFSPEGTFRAAQAQLPRLQALGVDVIWLMPIHPIGELNRKGTLGSPYAVRDYYGVNPEFGTMADLRAFVDEAHRLGMHVILDWVANHTSWDNPLYRDHPDWYERDWDGAPRPTLWFDWHDIIDLDYSRPEVRQYMTQAMAYWVREADVDGFRADVAGLVPIDFWDNVRSELDAIKPVFMLAEWEYPELHRGAFDATYAWGWFEALHRIAQGRGDVGGLVGWLSWDASAWPHEAMRLMGTQNHDKNSWDGTEYELFGPALDNVTVLNFVARGLPMIYNGQEGGNNRRLEFFERDPIIWPATEHPNAAMFRRLIRFRDAHPALHNGRWGAPMIPVVNSAHPHVLSFVRQQGDDKVFGIFNMSAAPRDVRFTDGPFAGHYVDYADASRVTVDAETVITIPAWGHRVLTSAP